MAFTYRTIKGSELTWAELDENFRLVDQYHDESKNAAVTALSSANFKGDWSTLAGSLNTPASVRHSGYFWMLLQNVVNVTTEEPGVSSKWAKIPNGDVVGPLTSTTSAIARFSDTTGKLLKNGVTTISDTGQIISMVPLTNETLVARLGSIDGGDSAYLDLKTNNVANEVIYDSTGTNSGAHVWRTGGVERVRLTATGLMGVGKTPAVAVDVLGSLRLSAAAAVAGAYQQLDFRAGVYTKCAIRGYSVTTIDAGELRFMTAPDSDVIKDRLVITSTGNVLSVSGTIGYGAGAGGVVTQSTNKSTAVSLNKPCGRITTHNAALAAGASVNFTLNNNNIGDLDTLQVNAATSSNYLIQCVNCSEGSALIRITNISATSQSEAIPINFNVLKGVSS